MVKKKAKEAAVLPFEGETAVALFKNNGGARPIRKTFHNEQWYFSIVDVIEALTGSSSPSRYWTELRDKIVKEGDQLFAQIERLKMPSADGKDRLTDATNTEALFRIIQSIPSPKAEPLKRWLAKVGFERLQETASPELAIKRAIVSYQMLGYPDDWINARVKTIASRNELTSEWAKRGVKDGVEYAVLTNVISERTFQLDTKQHKDYKRLGKGDNLRDHMTDIELILTMLGEKSTTSIAVARNAQGFRQNEQAAQSGGKIAGDARRKLEVELGRSVVSSKNYLPDRPEQDQLVEETPKSKQKGS